MKHVGRPTDETDSNQRQTGKAIKNGINISFPESDICGRNVQCTGPVCRGVNIAGRRNRADPRVSALALKKCGHRRKCEACWKKTIFMAEEIWPHITVIMNKIFP